MANKAELIAEQLLGANLNKKTWGDIIHNAKLYGAKADGVTDDTEAVQRAINAADGTSNLVFIPFNTKYTQDNLIVPSGVILWDESSGYSIKDLVAGAQKNSIVITRDANYSGGQPGWVNSAIYSVATARDGTKSYEWGITSVMNNYSADGGENVGIYGQGNSWAPATKTWGGVFEARDKVGGIPQSLVGLEVDLFSDSLNGDNKIVLDVVVGKNDASNPNTPLFYAGIRVSPQAGVYTNGKFSYGLLMEGEMESAINLQGTGTFGYRDKGTYVVGIDLSQGTHADSALRIKGGEAIALDEYSDIKMKYNPTTGFIEFYGGGARKGYIDVSAAGADHAL